MAIKKGTQNILKTKRLPSLIPLREPPNKKKSNHHKVKPQSTIKKIYLSSMKLIECVPLLIVYDFFHNNFSLANVTFFWFFSFLYSAGLIIREFKMFHVFFTKVSCNRYSLNNFMLWVLLNVQLLHKHTYTTFFDAHIWTVTHCNITRYEDKKKIIHIFRKFDSLHGVEAFMIYFWHWHYYLRHINNWCSSAAA